MKSKLRLDDLSVESFTTTPDGGGTRGTVRGLDGTVPPPPDDSLPVCWTGRLTCLSCELSYPGTCDITCNRTVDPQAACEQTYDGAQFTCGSTCLAPEC